MIELRQAAFLYDVERSYREPLLKRMIAGIRPGETERIWGKEAFRRQARHN
jgi:hypothetical protein